MLRLALAIVLTACVAGAFAPSAAALDAKADLDALRDQTRRVQAREGAARSLARELGAKAADDLIDVGARATTPPQLADTIVGLLAAMKDPAVERKLAAGISKGIGASRVFHLRAARDVADPKAVKELLAACIDLTDDREDALRERALAVLVERECLEAVPALLRMLKKEADPTESPAIVAGLTKIRRKDAKSFAEWGVELEQLTLAASPYQRNAALDELGKLGKSEHLAAIGKQLAHKDWSTRVSAVMALERMHLKAAIPLLVAAMKEASGRTLEELAEALERMTGLPIGEDAARWDEWWRTRGGEFELPALSDRPSTTTASMRRHAGGDTRVDFLGLPISSHRIVFVLDVSGSMNQPASGVLAGNTGVSGSEATTRIDVVKRALCDCIDKLDADALFNVITFSTGVATWLDGLTKAGNKTREQGKAFVQAREASGGTNLYDGLRKAFEDGEADTIYVLSDGQPTGERDPAAIRTAVAQWNMVRHVRIHTIAVGERLDLLRHLAEDSGGTHVQYE